jgi:hypothetical protein
LLISTRSPELVYVRYPFGWLFLSLGGWTGNQDPLVYPFRCRRLPSGCPHARDVIAPRLSPSTAKTQKVFFPHQLRQSASSKRPYYLDSITSRAADQPNPHVAMRLDGLALYVNRGSVAQSCGSSSHQEPLSFRSGGFSPPLSLLHTCILNLDDSPLSHDKASPSYKTLYYPGCPQL